MCAAGAIDAVCAVVHRVREAFALLKVIFELTERCRPLRALS
jgi:hypothetical protein